MFSAFLEIPGTPAVVVPQVDSVVDVCLQGHQHLDPPWLHVQDVAVGDPLIGQVHIGAAPVIG